MRGEGDLSASGTSAKQASESQPRLEIHAAAAKDPKNPYIKNNLELLDKSFRSGKAVQ